MWTFKDVKSEDDRQKTDKVTIQNCEYKPKTDKRATDGVSTINDQSSGRDRTINL
jgi:hypothetical protein